MLILNNDTGYRPRITLLSSCTRADRFARANVNQIDRHTIQFDGIDYPLPSAAPSVIRHPGRCEASPPSRDASSAPGLFSSCSLRRSYPAHPRLWKGPVCLHQQGTTVSSHQVQAARRSCNPATPLLLVSGDMPTMTGVSFSCRARRAVRDKYLPRAVPVEANGDHAEPHPEKSAVSRVE